MRRKQADRIIELLELIYKELKPRGKMIDGRPLPTPNKTKTYRKGL